MCMLYIGKRGVVKNNSEKGEIIDLISLSTGRACCLVDRMLIDFLELTRALIDHLENSEDF